MIITLLSVILSIVFSVLGIIHFYWMFGGKWGLNGAIPTTSKGEVVLAPKKRDCFTVGLGLILFGLCYLVLSEIIFIPTPNGLIQLGGKVIPAIFILRSIGDFRYIGFFKKVKHTKFGHLDTIFFSPLCLTIGILGIIIIMNIGAVK